MYLKLWSNQKRNLEQLLYSLQFLRKVLLCLCLTFYIVHVFLPLCVLFCTKIFKPNLFCETGMLPYQICLRTCCSCSSLVWRCLICDSILFLWCHDIWRIWRQEACWGKSPICQGDRAKRTTHTQRYYQLCVFSVYTVIYILYWLYV